jgi:membrane protease YdiL (CAAX protease family)
MPWGYGSPPPAEAPGRLHPVAPRRKIRSLNGRAAPRKYAAGWLLSFLGLGILIAIIAARQGGLARGVSGLAAASVLELALVLLSVGLVAASLAQGSQRRADGWQDYFGPSPFLVVLAWLSLSLAAELVLVAVVDFLGISLATSVETLLVLGLNLGCYAVLVHIVAVRPGALSWRDIARPRRLAPDPSDWSFSSTLRGGTAGGTRSGAAVVAGDIALGFALAIPGLIATLILTAILVAILGVQSTDVSEPIPTLFPGWDLPITLLSLAVVAPIGEEIFFRGFATNAWARSLKRNDAIVRAAVFFACVHIINLVGGVNADVFTRAAILAVAARIPVAWLLAWVYTRRRSIFASVALHGTYNGLLVLLVWWASTIR